MNAREKAAASAEKKAQRKAEKNAKKRSDDLLAVKDKRKQKRHDFLVAAFSSAFALLIEHIGDIVYFVQKLFGIAD